MTCSPKLYNFVESSNEKSEKHGSEESLHYYFYLEMWILNPLLCAVLHSCNCGCSVH